MLHHIHRNRLGYVLLRWSVDFLQGLFAGQLKTTVGGQNIFDPMNGAANSTFRAMVIVGDGLHRGVFAVVFESDEEFVADCQGYGFAAGLVLFVVGGL